MRTPLTPRRLHQIVRSCIRSPLIAPIVVSMGCDLPLGTGCDTIAKPGIRVDIIDSVSGAGIAPTTGARVIARSATYADTASLSSSHVALVYERPGTYSVIVEHPAYLTWSRSEVRVRENDCHVIPVELTARLQPAS